MHKGNYNKYRDITMSGAAARTGKLKKGKEENIKKIEREIVNVKQFTTYNDEKIRDP